MKVISATLALAAALLAAAPAFAAGDVQWRLDPDTLPPAQRRQALTAPLGFTGPFGEPSPSGCKWSRIQLVTTQGLKWFVEQTCDGQEFSGK
jgi:hypothetical protein